MESLNIIFQKILIVEIREWSFRDTVLECCHIHAAKGTTIHLLQILHLFV